MSGDVIVDDAFITPRLEIDGDFLDHAARDTDGAARPSSTAPRIRRSGDIAAQS